MKIPLYLEKEQISTNIIRVSHGKKHLGFIKAIIDTGSPVTVISEGDALKMQIPVSNLPSGGHHYGLGGSAIELKYMTDITFSMRTVEEKTENVHFDQIGISKSAIRDERALRISQAVPSIIGLDFLRDNKFTLHIDLTKNELYLER